MGGSRRGPVIVGVVLASVLGMAIIGVVAVILLHRTVNVSAAQVAGAVDGEVRAGGITGATPARCPSGLRLEVGRSVRCSVAVDGQPVDVIITITSVGPVTVGGRIGYGIRLEPNPIPKAVLERKVGELVGRSTGAPVEATTCAADLPPVIGRRTTCTVTSGGGPAGVAVMTTGVDGGMVRFAIGPQ